MAELDLMPGLMVGLVGLLTGLALVLMNRGEPGDDGEAEARRRDLEQRKAHALQALRDLDDVQGARGVKATSEERAELERRAAEAMMALDRADAKGKGKGKGKHKGKQPPPPAPTPAPAAAAMNPKTQGFLMGAVVMGIGAAIIFGLDQGTTPRTDGMTATGGPPGLTSRPPAQPGAPGSSVPGVPPNLAPKPSPIVDQARAAVSASPDSPQAWADLGWALVEAEGWIDVWNVASELLEIAPGHPDGLTLQATVRLTMGMDDQAATLLDQALLHDPNHVMAMSWKGSVLLRSGDREGAKTIWSRAALIAPEAGFDRLIVMADSADLTARPAPHPGGASAPPHPGGASAPPHPTAPTGAPPAAGGNRISGTLSLGDGAQTPPGGVIFVIARQPGVAGGPPVATVRLPAHTLPLDFALGDEHVMMGGPFPARVDLTARWDADGNAMTRGDADLHAAGGTVDAGAVGLALVLN